MSNSYTVRRLDALQLFRGIAALGVVFHHATQSVSAFSNEKMPDLLHSLFGYGYLGVDFFFVLSGFIILNSHFDDNKGIDSARSYLLKRVLRIFPPYLPISILLLVSYTVFPGLSAGVRGDISIISSLLLLPSENPPALSVAWTLIHEMLFYIVFLLFFIGKRLFAVVACFWAIAIIYFESAIGGQISNPLFSRLFAVINLEFIMGMACGIAWKRFGERKFYGVLSLALGFILLPVLIFLNLGEDSRAFFGIPFSFIVLGGAQLSTRSQSFIPATGILLGDASYAIYLIHNPLQSLTSRIVRYFSTVSSWWLMLIVGVLASVIAGIAYHKLFEKPVTRYLRSRTRGRLAPSSPAKSL